MVALLSHISEELLGWFLSERACSLCWKAQVRLCSEGGTVLLGARKRSSKFDPKTKQTKRKEQQKAAL